jgi:hypothetical protein
MDGAKRPTHASKPRAGVEDDMTKSRALSLDQAIRAAIDDIATHAVAFTPTMVSRQEAKLVGDRIYLLLLLADATAEAEMKGLKMPSTQSRLSSR